MNRIKKYAFSAMLFLFPVVAAAQINVNDPGIVGTLQQVFDILAPIFVTLIILYILWGAFRFATAGGSEEARESGKQIMLYGAIGLVVIGSLLGLIGWLLDIVQVNDGIDVNNVGDNFGA